MGMKLVNDEIRKRKTKIIGLSHQLEQVFWK
jgi:hypothetical protein